MSSVFESKNTEGDDGWISVSDLMAGLMMVFMFISIIYAKTADERAQTITEVVAEWEEAEWKIFQSLQREFKYDLPKWKAEIDRETLTIRFLTPTPEVLFQPGKKEIQPKFQKILSEFMPRYIRLLKSEFEAEISEVRIEGHTSSEWNKKTSKTDAFIKNMALSQARTRSVLEYALAINALEELKPWMTKKVSANGLSSARLISTNGIENKRLSRRVEFTVRTKTREALMDIMRKAGISYDRKI